MGATLLNDSRAAPLVLTVDCRELTIDEQLALASALSDELQGGAVALLRDEDIVFDVIGGKEVDEGRVMAVVREFVGRRKEGDHYGVELKGDRLIVHSADPLARSRGRRKQGLPPNILKCPACNFVTPYEEALVVHLRSHYAGLTG